MSNKEIFEAELLVQHGLIQQGKDVITAIDDAIYDCTGQRLSQSEKDNFEGDPVPQGFREFLDWVIGVIKKAIQWLLDWWNE